MGPVGGIIISWTLDVKANVFPSCTTSYKTIHPVLHLKNSIACTAYFLSGGNIDMIACKQRKIFNTKPTFLLVQSRRALKPMSHFSFTLTKGPKKSEKKC